MKCPICNYEMEYGIKESDIVEWWWCSNCKMSQILRKWYEFGGKNNIKDD